MNKEPIFIVSQGQMGNEDPSEFLRKAIHKQFEGKEYYIAREDMVTRPTYYSSTPRKLRGYMINESGVGHAIWFDVTDINTLAWTSQ